MPEQRDSNGTRSKGSRDLPGDLAAWRARFERIAHPRERHPASVDRAAAASDYDLWPGGRPAAGALKPAAVLVALVDRNGEAHMILTRRTHHLRSHAGQVAFPGGKIDPGEDAVSAALREAHEEIGLVDRAVDVLGLVDPYETRTGYRVTPVLAVVDPEFTPRANPAEVDTVFDVPVAFLMDARNHERHTVRRDGQVRAYYAMPYGEHFIWGATAGMIRALAARLGTIEASVP